MPENETIPILVSRFQSLKVLVIGDIIVDVYIRGTSSRLCPEAPVPVVDIHERAVYPGGAANTACNLQSLGAQVTLCSVVGTDHAGDEAIELLKKTLGKSNPVLRDESRESIVKSRIVAGRQLITRFDAGTTAPVSVYTTEQMAVLLRKIYADYDAVVISDYDKGVVTDELIDVLAELQRKHGKFLAVDSKRLSTFKRLAPSLVKPNYEEAAKLLGLSSQPKDRHRQILSNKDQLRAWTGAEVIAVTLDSDGAIIFSTDDQSWESKAPKISSPQVSGAGDSFLSAFTLAYLVSNDIETSAETASAAASIAISKESTANCTAAELKCHFNMMAKHVASTEDLAGLCDSYREAGKRIVFTNGCFDILHTGHVTYLACARELGDVLIVGLNTDESIKRLKGSMRPVNPLHDRLHVLSGLSSVDHVVTFGEPSDDTPVGLIQIVRPDVFVKGGDYRTDELPELNMLKSVGAEVVIIPSIPDRSTTRIIKRMHQTQEPAPQDHG